MSKLKPYLYWIICGVILLVEIVVVLAISPSGKDGKSAEAVKKELDENNANLLKLYTSANAGSPAAHEPFDVEKKDDLEALTTRWLATPSWKQVLDDHVKKYRAQTESILDFLRKRSAYLNRPLSDEHAPNLWYTHYQEDSAKILTMLFENKCLVIPAKQAAGNRPAPGTAGGGTGGSGTGGGSAPAVADDGAPDFMKSKELRGIGGFLTSDKYPESSEWPKLTRHFHVMEMVADALLKSKSTNLVSPVVPAKIPYESNAQLVGITGWKDDSDDQVGFTLNLQGSISSLLAAEAALEENLDDTRPIMIITSAQLTRKSFQAGERRDITSEPVLLKLTGAVLDYSNLPPLPPLAPPPEAKKPAAPAAKAPAPAAASTSTESAPTSRSGRGADAAGE